MGEAFKDPASPNLDRDRREALEYWDRTKARIRGDWTPAPFRRGPPRRRWKRSTHILIVGDPHADPEVPNHRFQALGHFIDERRPDAVVQMGDLFDLSSLHGLDKSPRALIEGKRYWRDIDHGIDALARMTTPWMRESCELYALLGNHEARIVKYLAANPIFGGAVGLHNLMLEDYGWRVVPFLESVNVAGVHFSHYWKQAASEREVTSVAGTARAVILKRPGSFCRVQGHDHRLEFWETYEGATERNFRKISGMSAGCFFPLDSLAHRWARDDVNRWRAGISELVAESGQIVDLTWTDFDRVMEFY